MNACPIELVESGNLSNSIVSETLHCYMFREYKCG